MNKLKKIFLTAVATLTVATVSAAGEEPAAESYRNNRHPLLQKDYIQLPLGTIRAEGWMHDQLTRMRDGMTGHLDKVYTKVMGPRNGWLGGDGDVWERGPYWIDGLLPLAYLLNDQALIEKVQPWIEWTLASQKPNGYFGPDTDRDYEPGLQRNNAQDWWPKMVMLKVMQQYYTATQDRRVIDFMTRYFRYQLDELPKNPLGKWTFWGEQRGGDNLMVVYWLYNITGDKFLLDLGELIHKQTFNWTDIFLNQNHLRRQHSLHCVNLAQGFKEPIVYYQQGKDSKQIQATRQAVNDIRHTIGLPTGLWGGDELLRFGKPTTGSELCTAVEMMYSLETILGGHRGHAMGRLPGARGIQRLAHSSDRRLLRPPVLPADQPDRRHPRVEGVLHPARRHRPAFRRADRLSLLHVQSSPRLAQIRPEPLVRDCRQRTRLPALRPLASNGTSGRRNRGEPERGNGLSFRGDSTLPCFVYGQESEKGLLPLPPAHTGLVQATGGQAQRQTADGRCLSRNRHTYQPGMERGRYPIPRTADGGDRQPLV